MVKGADFLEPVPLIVAISVHFDSGVGVPFTTTVVNVGTGPIVFCLGVEPNMAQQAITAMNRIPRISMFFIVFGYLTKFT